jgi:hypothetical protein
MTSSTLPSDRSRPRLLIQLFSVAAIAWLGAAAYTLWGNPEVRDFVIGARIKRTYSQQITRQFGPKTIVFGGSSSSFSVDNAYATELGLPMANLALGAGMGLQVLTRFALLEARPGDTLVMMMEPDLFRDKLEPLQLGQQFAIAINQPRLALDDLKVDPDRQLPIRVYLSALRPGGFHVGLVFAKLISRTPLYRYNVGEHKPSGQKITSVRIPPVYSGGGARLSPDSRQFLADLRDWCAAKHVRLVYALPWAYCPPDQVRAFQRQNLATLRDIAPLMDVLADSRLGAYSEEGQFADTSFHLNEQGARIRTAELVPLIQQWRVWKASDLETIAGRGD